MNTGERIRALRKEKKLTLAEFADKIGLTAAAVSKIENGLSTPYGSTVKAISGAFCVSEKWIMTGEGEPGNFEGDEDGIFAAWAAKHLSGETNDFKHRFMRVIMSFSDSDWKLIEKWVNDMKNPPGE